MHLFKIQCPNAGLLYPDGFVRTHNRLNFGLFYHCRFVVYTQILGGLSIRPWQVCIGALVLLVLVCIHPTRLPPCPRWHGAILLGDDQGRDCEDVDPKDVLCLRAHL